VDLSKSPRPDDRCRRSGGAAFGHHRAVLQEHDPPVEAKTAAVVDQLQQGRLGAASPVGQRHDDRASHASFGSLP
jgi:hypothetical protein